MKKSAGQVIIILLLVILVVLAIGVAIVQKSLSDVSTSSKIEHSSRAFSAAEAGLESALLLPVGSPTTINTGSLGNDSSAKVEVNFNLPDEQGQALEYPPFTKADFAHFWLKDPSPGGILDYDKNSFRIWFGNCQTPCWNVSDANNPKPAIEVVIVLKDGSGNYLSQRRYYDSDTSRDLPGFEKISNSNPNDPKGYCTSNGQGVFTTSSSSLTDLSKFYCWVRVDQYKSAGEPFIARVRILYSSQAQKVALEPTDNGVAHFLPPQAALISSEGISGDVVRRLRVLKVKDVVPPFFDFAIFSTGPIKK